MKGLRKFLSETWWVFGIVTIASITAGYYTGIWPYYVFPPMLIPVAIYMASVRYDAEGNLREENRQK